MSNSVVISVVQTANSLASKMEGFDKDLEDLMNSIQDVTAELTNPDISQKVKYDAIVSIEYLLLKARLNCEFEHLKVKSILNKQDTPAMLKALFVKRDQYLAQVSLKLNSIREDINTLQKVVYTQSTRNVK